MALSTVAIASAITPPSWSALLLESDPATQTAWAKRYRVGQEVAADKARAWQLLCTAALRGYGPAQYEMGQWLMQGPRRQPTQAATWFHMADRRGEPRAAKALAALKGVKAETKTDCITAAAATTPLPGRRPTITAQSRLRRVPVLAVAPAQIHRKVNELAPRYGLDPHLVLALIQVESNFRSDALSPKNAQGLMQLIPDTATRFGVTDPWDMEQNLRGGMAYLRWLHRRFDGDWERVLAGYNAGEGAVTRFNGIPPYPETQAYVQKVLALYERRRPKLPTPTPLPE